ncbi:hypothetical protein Enr13x_17350 [Stieleria neptunia]|uniref:Uncharacterized protein n=1 Tax=Stieleria neptunia TaxID=2527979 RepID=A0A518HM03_9BACT|nr:hypothetical protein [Stieleria neptunia]QDV41892.1 hypothetical protein Enr13x_17350 [Stieleria neptunia]
MNVFPGKPVVILCCFAAAVWTQLSHGQVMRSPAIEKSETVVEPASPSPPLVLHARQQSDPPLRYRLWPAPERRRPRGAMVAVNRSMLLVAQVSAKQKRDFLDRYDAWSQMPLDELPVEQAKASCLPFETAIGVLRTGENWMDLKYDLGLEDMSFSEKLGTLLPELQESRDLARLLCMRARVAAAEHRWTDAVDDLRLGFRLSEITAHSTNTLLSRLIGIAISESLLETIESMIQQPDCPNLYWALAGLPVDRLFEMREAIEYESTVAYHAGILAGLDELPDEIIGEARALNRLKELSDVIATMYDSVNTPAETTWLHQLSTGVLITMMVQPSRQLLLENDDWKERVDELSDAEAVLRASDFELSRIRERWLAWSLLPSDLWDVSKAERDAAMKVSTDTVTLGGQLARVMLPSFQTATSSGLDVKQQHHRLLTLEALRMHAAETGALPEAIDNLTPVPAWLDPISRKPFVYLRQTPTEATLSRAAGRRNKENLTLSINLQVTQ